MDEFREISEDMPKYDFYVWDSKPMRATGIKSRHCSSKKNFKQDGNKEENKVGDNAGILHVPVTDSEDAIYVDSKTAVNARVFNVGDCHQADLFVRIEQI